VINFRGFDIDTSKKTSAILGVIVGLEYNPDPSQERTGSFSKCFLAANQTIDFYEIWMTQVNNVMADKNFFQILVYNPIHYVTNLAALVEVCNFNRFLDIGYQFTNLDPAFVTESLTRQITVAAKAGNMKLIQDAFALMALKDATTLEGIDFFDYGQKLGEVVKALFDVTIDA